MSDTNGVPPVVPPLADVVKNRSLLSGLSVQVIAGYIVGLAAVQQDLGAALAVAKLGEAPPPPLDRSLTIEEAAARLNLAPATMQKWLRKPPYDAAVIVRTRSMVRVSEQRLEAVLRKSTPRAPSRPRPGTGLLDEARTRLEGRDRGRS